MKLKITLFKKNRRKVAVGVSLIVVGFLGVIGYTLYEDMYGRDYYDRYLSENVVLHSFADNKWKVYNESMEIYTTDRIDWLSENEKGDTLAVYSQNDRRGFINVNTGEIIIDATKNNYENACFFNEGVAAVVQSGKIGFINVQNQVVIPFQFDYSNDDGMETLAHIFNGGHCVMSNIDGELGLIDTNGNWVIKPMYDEISIPEGEGYRVVVSDGKYGVLTPNLECKYETIYEFIGNYSEEGNFVLIKGGKMWQEDLEGNVLVPYMFEFIENINYPYEVADNNNEGYEEYEKYAYAMSDYAIYFVSQKCGIINRTTGKPITLAIYEDIRMISENIFEVTSNVLYGKYLIDTNGNIIKP